MWAPRREAKGTCARSSSPGWSFEPSMCCVRGYLRMSGFTGPTRVTRRQPLSISRAIFSRVSRARPSIIVLRRRRAPGVAGEHGVDVGLVEAHHAGVGEGRDGGRAGHAREQRHLAEEGPALEGGEHHGRPVGARGGDLDDAAVNEIEIGAVLALAEHHVVAGEEHHHPAPHELAAPRLVERAKEERARHHVFDVVPEAVEDVGAVAGIACLLHARALRRDVFGSCGHCDCLCVARRRNTRTRARRERRLVPHRTGRCHLPFARW